MAKRNQSEHIESLIQESLSREQLIEKIQKLYKACTEEFSNRLFTELIEMTERLAHPWVVKRLWNADCYSDENEHSALQESRLAIWDAVKQSRDADDPIDNFAFYAFAIYKWKTVDTIRKALREKKRFNPTSLEGQMEEGNQGKSSELPHIEDDYGERETMRHVYSVVFNLYCTCLMDSGAFPPRCLALYYARILPHLLAEIPDSKITSATWAAKRMGESSIWELTQDSEKDLKEMIGADLSWGPDYLNNLEKEYYTPEKHCRLRDVIYTSAFSKAQIEDWADSMHKAVMKEAWKRLLNDNQLELVMEYEATRKGFRKVMKGKGGKYR